LENWNVENFVNVKQYLKDYVSMEVVEDKIWFHPDVGEHRTFAVNIRKIEEIPQKYYGEDKNDLAEFVSALMQLISNESFLADLRKYHE
jgi:hypothetical protein